MGIVGPPDRRERTEKAILYPHESKYADEGFEQVTLQWLYEYAWQNDGVVLYGHTKGASRRDYSTVGWRTVMINQVVRHWERNLLLLEDHDAVGCHWLTVHQYTGMIANSPIFGGNFWMATTAYIRRLQAIGLDGRYRAEEWIGLADPCVVDLFPGWPGAYDKPQNQRAIYG
jgi:hypothetical protein